MMYILLYSNLRMEYTSIFAAVVFALTATVVTLKYRESYLFEFLNIKYLIFIPIIAGSSYLFIYQNFDFLSIGPNQVSIPRYIDWFITTLIISYVTTKVIEVDLSSKVNMVLPLCLTAGVIISGFLSESSVNTDLKSIFFAFGGICFAILILFWMELLSQIKIKKLILSKLVVYFVFFVWSLYPVVTLLGYNFTEVLDREYTIVFYTALDISSKVVFVLILTLSQKIRSEQKEISNKSKLSARLRSL